MATAPTTTTTGATADAFPIHNVGELVAGNSVLIGFMLWTLFGYVVAHIDCNLQLRLRQNPGVGYLTLLVCGFFLFVQPYFQTIDPEVRKAVEPNTPPSLGVLWLRTLVVFLLVVLWIKSKWQFALAAMTVLLAENLTKYALLRRAHDTMANGQNDAHQRHRLITIVKWTSFASAIAVVLIVMVGAFMYVYEFASSAAKEHGASTANLQNIYRLFVCADAGSRTGQAKPKSNEKWR